MPLMPSSNDEATQPRAINPQPKPEPQTASPTSTHLAASPEATSNAVSNVRLNTRSNADIDLPVKASAAKGGLWQASGFALERISQFIAQIFLARLLLPEDFGVWGMVLILTRLSNQFKDSATASVLIYSGLKDKKLVDAVYSLTLNISIGMFILQSLLGYPLSRLFEVAKVWPLAACTATVFLIGAGAGVHSAVLQRRMQFKEIAIAEGLAGIARFGTAIMGALLGWGVWAFAFGEIAMALVDAIAKRYLSRYPFKYSLLPDAQALRQVGGYISKIVGGNLAVYVNTNSDNFLIGKFLGTSALGFYSIAYQLAMLPTFALSKINRVTFSVLSQRDNTGKRNFLVHSLELYGLSNAPIYGAGLLLAPWLIPTLYGEAWRPAVVLFQIILGFAYTRGFMAILGISLNAFNKPGVNAMLNWLLVVASMPAFVVGAKMNGSVGVAIAALLILGIGATIGFWIITCRVAGWNLSTLAMPILFPTLSLLSSLGIVYALPLAESTQPFLPTLLFLVIYVSIISLFSAGRALRQLLSLTLRFVK
jgi:lipopolysaccharide exporter